MDNPVLVEKLKSADYLDKVVRCLLPAPRLALIGSHKGSQIASLTILENYKYKLLTLDHIYHLNYVIVLDFLEYTDLSLKVLNFFIAVDYCVKIDNFYCY